MQLLFQRPPQRTSQLQEKPSAHKREHPALQNMDFFPSIFTGHFCPPGSGSTDPNWIHIQYGSETEVPVLVKLDSYVNLLSTVASGPDTEEFFCYVPYMPGLLGSISGDRDCRSVGDPDPDVLGLPDPDQDPAQALDPYFFSQRCWADWNNACKIKFYHKILTQNLSKK